MTRTLSHEHSKSICRLWKRIQQSNLIQQAQPRIPQKNESNCNICERKFHIAYILKKHIGNVNTIEKCNVCDRGVAKDELARHMKTHHWCLWWYLLWRDIHGKSHFNRNIHVGVLFMKFFYYRAYLIFVIFFTLTYSGLKILHSKLRKFATKVASRQNSVNQYWEVKFTLCV